MELLKGTVCHTALICYTLKSRRTAAADIDAEATDHNLFFCSLDVYSNLLAAGGKNGHAAIFGIHDVLVSQLRNTTPSTVCL